MINSSTTPTELAVLLGTSHAKLSNLLYGHRPEKFYFSFTIRKKNGGLRNILAPKDRLKSLQRKVADFLEELYQPSGPATAFIKNKGLIENATPHVNKALVFNVDLEGFFDSIHFGRIVGLLCSHPYKLKHDTARYIATLCCFNGKLPQGSPASPVISNMVARQLDRKLSLLARDNLAFYTRYADDITFSFRNLNHNGICLERNGDYYPSDKLLEIIDSCGFLINSSKTRGAKSDARQVVTGLKVNKKVNVDRRYVRITKAMIHSIGLDEDAANAKYWEANPSKVRTPLRNVVAGRISYIRMIKGVDSSVYEMLAYKFNSLPIDIKLNYNDSFSHTGYNVERLAGSEKYLTNCMWVVCFTEENGASSDDTFVQGSAFMISGQRVITCNHTFKAASDLHECTIYQAHNQKVKYRMRKKEFCEHRDYVELEFIDEPKVKFSTFRVFKEHKLIAGYKLTLVGFPEYHDNQKIANIVDAKVVSTQYMSKIYRYEVDVEISAGFSGGAVVNRYGQLVGMVTHGKTVTYADDDKDKPIIEGKSLFLGSENFL